ncbi:MAG: exodeoxyribonuclease V subunit gamma, partial [Propionibacteriaceae bacterium]|nr:exodeoxyribonuclease V subunit gamma [Propionibacteriaceae bacterium]
MDFRAADLGRLADDLLRRWESPPPDEFAFDYCLVSGAGVSRWLGQRAGERFGVSAGVRFPRFAGFEAEVLGPRIAPWRPGQLAWVLHRASSSPDSALEPLRGRLAGSHRPHAQLLRVAGRFAAYAEFRPEMVARWRAGEDVDADGRPLGADAWQAALWRAARDLLGEDGAEAYAAAVAGLRSCPGRVAVFNLPALSGRQRSLLAKLAEFGQVDTFQLTEPNALPSTPVEVHLSHGLARQVEVLRDLLAAEFQADSTLTPRDVVVLTPALAPAAPLVNAAFAPENSHPGARLRVQVGGRSAP